MAGDQRRDCRVPNDSLCGSARSEDDETRPRGVGSGEQACVRCSRIHDGADVRCFTQARRGLSLDRRHGFVSQDLTSLRVTGGQLWKQHVDRIEFWDDVTHDQAGAQVVGEVVPFPQSLVRCGGEIRAYQDWSLELHGYATAFCRSIRAFLAVGAPDWFEG